jgi:seryl-tRNA synthetase
VVCTPEQSDALHQELIQIEQDLFTELDLHFKVGAAWPQLMISKMQGMGWETTVS